MPMVLGVDTRKLHAEAVTIATLRRDPTVRFFLWAYLLAWVAWAPLVLSRTGIGWLPFRVPMAWTLPGAYAPLAAALIVQWQTDRTLRIGRLAPAPGWTVAGIAIGGGLVAAAFVVIPGWWLASAGPLAWAALGAFPWETVKAMAMAGPIGEEPGWRGFALPRMQQALGPIAATLLLGVLWTGWHLPLFFIPGFGGGSLWTYGLLVTGFAFLMTFAFNLSRGSVLVAMVLHGVFNASSGRLGGFLAEASLRPSPAPLVAIIVVFWAVALVLVVATRGRLGQARETGAG